MFFYIYIGTCIHIHCLISLGLVVAHLVTCICVDWNKGESPCWKTLFLCVMWECFMSQWICEGLFSNSHHDIACTFFLDHKYESVPEYKDHILITSPSSVNSAWTIHGNIRHFHNISFSLTRELVEQFLKSSRDRKVALIKGMWEEKDTGI